MAQGDGVHAKLNGSLQLLRCLTLTVFAFSRSSEKTKRSVFVKRWIRNANKEPRSHYRRLRMANLRKDMFSSRAPRGTTCHRLGFLHVCGGIREQNKLESSCAVKWVGRGETDCTLPRQHLRTLSLYERRVFNFCLFIFLTVLVRYKQHTRLRLACQVAALCGTLCLLLFPRILTIVALWERRMLPHAALFVLYLFFNLQDSLYLRLGLHRHVFAVGA